MGRTYHIISYHIADYTRVSAPCKFVFTFRYNRHPEGGEQRAEGEAVPVYCEPKPKDLYYCFRDSSPSSQNDGKSSVYLPPSPSAQNDGRSSVYCPLLSLRDNLSKRKVRVFTPHESRITIHESRFLIYPDMV